ARALKPLQIALVSIIEDSRVELLAGRRYPGLLRLWRNFHTAAPDGPKLAGPLMARLARALIDPAYKDDDPWVEKGRRLFMEAGPDWEDSEEIRRIGVLLGNDLGQMRVQFNPKTHVVQPPYRDDNLGIWDFGEQPPETADDPDVVHASARIQQTEDTSQPNQRQRNEESREEASMAARMQMVEEDAGIPITRQPEWDYIAGR
ncbi:MAG: hypothetical protein KDJ38_21375, partial [Gammaproteobacteria bacterium]|nr:hypothetical protein [Gammaproteobacteria bacterium]